MYRLTGPPYASLCVPAPPPAFYSGGMARPRSAAPVVLALVVDVVLVVAFAAAGRASHDEQILVGLVGTAGPFLIALLVGWAAARAWRAPLAAVRTGIPVWLVTVTGGMLLRVLFGQGTALAFIVVAVLTLGAMLVGWRGAWRLARRLRRPRAVADENMSS